MLCLPQYREPDLPWSYLVLQVARGARWVPERLVLTVAAVVAEHLGLDPDEVDEHHLDEALRGLPDDPAPFLARLLKPAGLALPDPDDDDLRLEEAAVRGPDRPAVDQVLLLHDAALVVLGDFGPDGFLACMESLDEPDWDARRALAAAMYLLLLGGRGRSQLA